MPHPKKLAIVKHFAVRIFSYPTERSAAEKKSTSSIKVRGKNYKSRAGSDSPPLEKPQAWYILTPRGIIWGEGYGETTCGQVYFWAEFL